MANLPEDDSEGAEDFHSTDPSELMEGVRNGDNEALEKVFHQYFTDLASFARKRLKGREAGGDGEDAAASAIRTFMRRAGKGQFNQLENQRDLFSLLSVIVLRKAIKYRKREDRYVQGSALSDNDSSCNEFLGAHAVDSGPVAEQVAIVNETLDQLLKALRAQVLRDIVLLQLEGHSCPYIAEELSISTRTVQRHVLTIREILSSIEEYDAGQ